MKGINLLSLERLEQQILKGVLKRRNRIVVFVLAAFLLYLLSTLPYFNIYIKASFAVAVSIVLAPFVLDLDEKLFFISALGFFIIVFFLWFLDWQRAEVITNYIFLVLLAGMLRALVQSFKTTRRH